MTRYLLAFVILISACVSVETSRPWSYTDLRALDAPDSTQPTRDLIALYTRSLGNRLNVRLDLLELNPTPDADVYLLLDSRPGGSNGLPAGINLPTELEGDILLVIPTTGSIQVLDLTEDVNPPVSLPDARVRVLRDPVKHSLEISLSLAGITPPGIEPGSGAPIHLEAFITPAGSTATWDSIGPVGSDDRPPPPAPVLFAFWNTLPAYTSAQALRRWDGAHTGPNGGRHGLNNLLRTASSAGIPLVLLDLNTAPRLSALDHLGQLAPVSAQAQAGQLILPENLPQPQWIDSPYILAPFLAAEKRLAENFGLSSRSFYFAGAGLAQSNHSASWLSRLPPGIILLPSSEVKTYEPVAAIPWSSWQVLPIPWPHDNVTDTPPAQITQQVDEQGFTTQVRRALVETALANSHQPGKDFASRLLILGGNLPASAWGNPASARAAFQFINDHPWTLAVNGSMLSTLNPGKSETLPASPQSPFLQAFGNETLNQLLAAFDTAPDNQLSQAAWQAFEALQAPIPNPPKELSDLRRAYLNQVYAILAAAKWSADPAPISDCSADLSLDGLADCVLASTTTFAYFDGQDGTLTYLFTLAADGSAHQLIGPTSQIISGLSDSASWKLDQGLHADPAVIAGAFGPSAKAAAGSSHPEITVANGEITYTYQIATESPTTWLKRFTLLADGIKVSYEFNGNPQPTTTLIPLLLDPWERFTPGGTWRYQQGAQNDSLSWEIAGGLRLSITSSAVLTIHTFEDSRKFFEIPEDPNRDYPRGHYLPIPFGLIEVSSPGNFTVQLHNSWIGK